MSWHTACAAFTAMVAGLLLPLLSVNGYAVASTEYLVALAACLGAGTLLASLARRGLGVAACVFGVMVLFASAYFAAPRLWSSHAWVPWALAATIGLFAYASIRFPREILLILGAGAGMHAVSSALLAPPMFTVQSSEGAAPTGEATPVLHVLLDEHAGLAAVPEGAMSPARRDAYVRQYVDRGFVVFTHAFSAETFSSNSLARLFNPSEPNPKALVADQAFPVGWALRRAQSLERIAQRRELRIYGAGEVNLAPAVAAIPRAKAEVRNLLSTHVGPERLRDSLSLADRISYAAGAGLNWLRSDFDSPLFYVAFAVLPLARHESGLDTRLLWLDESLASLLRLPRSAWYAFLHVLLPHTPYTYDASCALLPMNAWSSSQVPATPGWRLERYAAHMRQAECTSSRLLRTLDGFADRADWTRAAIVVHGDHGSRIAVEDRSEWPPLDGATGELARDIYATFLAVRMPRATKGAVVDRPVRIDDVFRELVEHDFASLDPAALPVRPHPFP